MQIKRIITNFMSENAYICEDGGEALICDPGGAADNIISALGAAKAKYIILTHGHFDHIMAAKELRERCGAQIVISREDAQMTRGAGNSGEDYGIFVNPFDCDLYAGECEIKIGESVFEVIKTPGHTQGSVCYLSGDVLLSGDTLFEGTIGKFDGRNAGLMKKSVLSLASLPDGVRVFPGHGDATTIGREKRENPYFDERNWRFF